jgi:hypothetical protein
MTSDPHTLAAITRLALGAGLVAGLIREEDGQHHVLVELPDGPVTWPIAAYNLEMFRHLVLLEGREPVPASLSEKSLEDFSRRRDTKPMQSVR